MSPSWLRALEKRHSQGNRPYGGPPPHFPEGADIQGPPQETGILIVVDGLASEIHDEGRRTELTE
jgi:hypothetical protein